MILNVFNDRKKLQTHDEILATELSKHIAVKSERINRIKKFQESVRGDDERIMMKRRPPRLRSLIPFFETVASGEAFNNTSKEMKSFIMEIKCSNLPCPGYAFRPKESKNPNSSRNYLGDISCYF